jgi:hypothetical protein
LSRKRSNSNKSFSMAQTYIGLKDDQRKTDQPVEKLVLGYEYGSAKK